MPHDDEEEEVSGGSVGSGSGGGAVIVSVKAGSLALLALSVEESDDPT